MKDLRKWMNLSEALGLTRKHQNDDEWLKSGDLTNWYSDGDVAMWFPEEGEDDGYIVGIQENWFELLDREVNETKQLALAQDYFQEWVMDEHKPAWITELKIVGSSEEYYWKIEKGEEDPDDY